MEELLCCLAVIIEEIIGDEKKLYLLPKIRITGF